jgi:hypothetical protein
MYEGYDEIKQAADEWAKLSKEYEELYYTLIAPTREGYGKYAPLIDEIGLAKLKELKDRKNLAEEHLHNTINQYYPLDQVGGY